MMLVKDFKWGDFLESEDWFIVSAGSFGMGKSSSCKKIASDFALEYLNPNTNSQFYIPVFIELKSDFENSYVYKTQKTFASLIDELVLNEEGQNKKFLLIIDIQQEYEQSLDELIYDLEKKIS